MVSRRVGRTVVAASVSVLGLVLGLVAQSLAFRWDDPRSWVPDLLVGWLLVTAGAVAWARRTVPAAVAGLTLLAGAAWWCGNLAGAGPSWSAWTAAQLTFVHRALLVHAVVTGCGALRRWDGLTLTVVAYVLAAPRLATEPAASVLLGLGLAAVAARGRRADSRGRTGGAAPAASLLAGTFLLTAVEGLLGGTGDAWLLVYEVGLVASGLALTMPWRRRAVGDVTDLVVRLGETPGGLDALLADVLGDPDVRLVERAGDRELDGPAPPDGYVATPVRTHDQGTTYLVHRQVLTDDSDLMASVLRAVGLLLDHERLQADLRARVGEVAQSRARLLQVADDESARLRDRIHEGAGARLDAVEDRLGAVARRGAGPGERVDDVVALATAAAARARRVRQDLADLEHALLPDLDGTPLATALGELAGASPIPVTLTVDAGLDVPRDAAAVVWFVCAEGLTNAARHARATRAEVTVSADPGRLFVTVADDGSGLGDSEGREVGRRGVGLRNLCDRVEAADGRLRLVPGDRGGTVLAVELPLVGRRRTDAAARDRSAT